MIIAVTGGIGCGKSTVTAIFRELGCVTIDADEVVDQLYRDNPGLVRKIACAFGRDVLTPDGAIDRVRLSGVLADPEGARRLNAIVHPAVIETLQYRYAEHLRQNPAVPLVVEVPLLYEAGIEEEFDAVVCVSCSLTTGLARFAAATGLPEEEAARRAARQLPVEEKARRADFVVDNSGSPESTRRAVLEIMEKLGRKAPS